MKKASHMDWKPRQGQQVLLKTARPRSCHVYPRLPKAPLVVKRPVTMDESIPFNQTQIATHLHLCRPIAPTLDSDGYCRDALLVWANNVHRWLITHHLHRRELQCVQIAIVHEHVSTNRNERLVTMKIRRLWWWCVRCIQHDHARNSKRGEEKIAPGVTNGKQHWRWPMILNFQNSYNLQCQTIVYHEQRFPGNIKQLCGKGNTFGMYHHTYSTTKNWNLIKPMSERGNENDIELILKTWHHFYPLLVMELIWPTKPQNSRPYCHHRTAKSSQAFIYPPLSRCSPWLGPFIYDLYRFSCLNDYFCRFIPHNANTCVLKNF